MFDSSQFCKSKRWRQAIAFGFGLVLMLLALMPKNAAAQAGAPFTCDVVFYQMRNLNTGTGSLLIKFSAVSNSVTPTAATPAVNNTIEINSIGYNPVDNYIYGIRADSATNTVYRIGQSGYELVGTLTQTVPLGLSLAGFLPTAGVFDAAGRYYFAGQGAGNIAPAAVFRVDAMPVTGNVKVVHQYSNTPTTVVNYGDFDFNGAGGPNGLLLAATQTNTYRISLTANATTQGIGTASHEIVTFPAAASVGGVGSAFYDAFTGKFYVFDNNGAGTFWEILNPEVGTPSPVATAALAYTGPPVFAGPYSPTDGTSCPLSGTRRAELQITKSDPFTTVTTGQVTNYSVTVRNNGPYPANYSVLRG